MLFSHNLGFKSLLPSSIPLAILSLSLTYMSLQICVALRQIFAHLEMYIPLPNTKLITSCLPSNFGPSHILMEWKQEKRASRKRLNQMRRVERMNAGGISTPLGTYGSPIARASSRSPPLFRSHHFHPLHFKLFRFVCLSHFCAFQNCYPPSFSDHLPTPPHPTRGSRWG